MKILSLTGSIRKHSTNEKILQAAKAFASLDLIMQTLLQESVNKNCKPFSGRVKWNNLCHH